MAIGESFGPRQEYKVVQMLPPVIRFTGLIGDDDIAKTLLRIPSGSLIEHSPKDQFLIKVPYDVLKPEYQRYFSAGSAGADVGTGPLIVSLHLDGIASETLFLRQLYNDSNAKLLERARAMLAQGRSEESVAKWIVRQRNALKIDIRARGPALFRKIAEWRNLKKYGNPVGPGYQSLRTGQRGPGMAAAAAKTDAQIINDINRTSQQFNLGAKSLRIATASLAVASFVLTATQNSPDALDPLPQSDEALIEAERARLRLGIPANANIDRHGHLKKNSYLQIDVSDISHAGDEIDQETEEILWWLGVPITYQFEGVRWTVPGR